MTCFARRAAAILNLTDDRAERHGEWRVHKGQGLLGAAMRPASTRWCCGRVSPTLPGARWGGGEGWGCQDGPARRHARLGPARSVSSCPGGRPSRVFLGETFWKVRGGPAMSAAAALILCFARIRLAEAEGGGRPHAREPPRRLERLGVTGGGVAYGGDSKYKNADSVPVALEPARPGRGAC